MKNNVLLFVTLFFVPLLSFGQEINVSLKFKAPEIIDAVNSDYSSIVVNDCTLPYSDNGIPEIPHRYVRVIIPVNSEVSNMNIKTSEEKKTLQLQKLIVPVQLPERTGRSLREYNFVEPSPAVYESKNPFPEKIAHVAGIEYMYGNKVVTIDVTPFQYYPNINELEFYGNIELSITLKEDPKDIFNRDELFFPSEEIREERYKMLFDVIENKDDFDKYAVRTTPAITTRAVSNSPGHKYVIVTSQALAPAFERFANWKRRKGMTVGIVTIEWIRTNYPNGDLVSGINDDAGKLRQFLKASYQLGTEFVLLGGDENIIPVRYAYQPNLHSSTYWDYVPTDLYFSEFSGNWKYVQDGNKYGKYNIDNVIFTPNIYVGRLLCSTKEHIENWTYKVMYYEKNPGRGDYSYLRKLFFTEADQLQYDHWSNYVSNYLSSFTTKTTYREIPDAYSSSIPTFPTGNDVLNEFNNNYGLVSFMGHGSPVDVAVGTKFYNDNNNPKHRVYTYDYIKSDPYNFNEYNNGGSLKNMKNDGYPNINYSVSCDNIPYDKLSPFPDDNVDDSFGEVVTSIYRTGSVAFLGNTRSGWISSSKVLFGYFANALNSGNTGIGVAEEISKNNISSADEYYRFLKFTHNIIGCPEMKVWTATPTKFTSASVTRSGNNVTVNSGVSGCKISVVSGNDYGSSYLQTFNGQSYTFTNVPVNYSVTITKDNYIPYLFNNDVALQNVSYSSGANFFNGNNFTISNVVLNGTTDLQLEPLSGVSFSNSFEVSNSAAFKIE